MGGDFCDGRDDKEDECGEKYVADEDEGWAPTSERRTATDEETCTNGTSQGDHLCMARL